MPLGWFYLNLAYWLPMVLLVFVIGYLYWDQVKKRKCIENLGIRGPRPLPILGNLLDLMSHPLGAHEALTALVKEYGKVFGLYLINTGAVVISDVDVLKKVLVEDFSKFHDRPKGGVVFGEPLASMLTVVEGERWKNIRSAITPCFTGHRLRSMLPCVRHAVHTMEARMCDSRVNDEPFNALEVMQLFALDVILSVAFGKQTDCQRNPSNAVAVTAKVVNTPRPWLRLLASIPCIGHILVRHQTKKIFHGMVTLLNEVVKERRQLNVAAQDFLQLMLQSQVCDSGYRLSDNEVVAQSMVFLLAGYETTSIVLTMSFYCLARYPNKMAVLQQEIDQACGAGDIGFEELRKMSYMDAVLNEVMRLYPPAFMLVRKCSEAFQHGSWRVEKGMAVIVPVYHIHHSEECFRNAENFHPERFHGEGQNSHPGFLPFGLGPRNCIGMRFALMEVKLVLATILRSHVVKIDPKTPLHIRMKPAGMLQPADPIWLRLEAR